MQVRRIGLLEPSRVKESTARDPGQQILEFMAPQGNKQAVVLNRANDVLLDEEDVLGVSVTRSENGRYSVQLKLDPKAEQRFPRRMASYLFPTQKVRELQLGLFLDGKVRATPIVKPPMTGDLVSIATGLTKPQADKLASKVSSVIPKR
jgi:preprotein translocase subunit SecD